MLVTTIKIIKYVEILKTLRTQGCLNAIVVGEGISPVWWHQVERNQYINFFLFSFKIFKVCDWHRWYMHLNVDTIRNKTIESTY